MITTGVVGQRWRASITPWGAIEPWDGSPPLDWYVAADDRWHVPRQRAGGATDAARRHAGHRDAAARARRRRRADGVLVRRRGRHDRRRDRQRVVVAGRDRVRPARRVDRATDRRRADRGHRPAGRLVRAAARSPARGFGSASRTTASAGGRAARHGCRRRRRWRAVGWRWPSARSRFVLPEGESGAALARRVIAERCELVLGGPADAGRRSGGVRRGRGRAGACWARRPRRGLVDEVAAAVEAVGADASWEVGRGARRRGAAVGGGGRSGGRFGTSSASSPIGRRHRVPNRRPMACSQCPGWSRSSRSARRCSRDGFPAAWLGAVDRGPRRADAARRRRCRWRCDGTAPDRRCCGSSTGAPVASRRRRCWRRRGTSTRTRRARRSGRRRASSARVVCRP